MEFIYLSSMIQRIFTVSLLMSCQASGLDCYTCSDTPNSDIDCLGSQTCGSDEVCMNTIRDENGQHRVSKECKQDLACNNQESQNTQGCHPDTSPSVCYYCCNDRNLCNEMEVPALAANVETSTQDGISTLKVSNPHVTTVETTLLGTWTRDQTIVTTTRSDERLLSTDTSTTESIQDRNPTTVTNDITKAIETTTSTTEPDKGLSCYTCSDTSNSDIDCLGSQTCGSDEVCMNTIRDENGQHRVSKECKQDLACNNQESQNTQGCHPDTSPSVCYYCCNDRNLCNEMEVPALAANVETSTQDGITTLKASTPYVTTVETTLLGTWTRDQTIVTTTRSDERLISTDTSTRESIQDRNPTTVTNDITKPIETTTSTTESDKGLDCYTCSDTPNSDIECLGWQTCGSDEVCMNTIRDENGQHRVSKECKQDLACKNQESQNTNGCHPDTSPSVCYYCCNDRNLCNEMEVPAQAANVETSTQDGITTLKASTPYVTTVETALLGTWTRDQTIVTTTRSDERLISTDTSTRESIQDRNPTTVTNDITKPIETTTSTTTESDKGDKSVVFKLVGHSTISTDDILLSQEVGSIIKCALLCVFHFCRTFTFDERLLLCNVSRENPPAELPIFDSLMYVMTN
ncbi:uncharacterized protein [Apostichopus japonicus]|uniref:uncharacterized protein n=1 Tax=Stichopus japonicus TaxID=307972 RepID=UPI003AB6A4CB